MQNLVDFQEYLTEQLKDPDRKAGFELEKEKIALELIINDILRKTGNDKYCVSLIEVEDY